MLCDPAQCTRILQALVPRIVYRFHNPANVAPGIFDELAHEATLTLHKATASYQPAFEYLVKDAFVSILSARGPFPRA